MSGLFVDKIGSESGGAILFENAFAFLNDVDRAAALDALGGVKPEYVTFEPTLIDETDVEASGYTVQTGSAVKIGKWVFANIYIKLSSKGAMAGVYTLIGNLPWPRKVEVGGYSSFAVGYYFGLAVPKSTVGGYMGSGLNWLYLTASNLSGAYCVAANMPTADIGDGFEVMATIGYPID